MMRRIIVLFGLLLFSTITWAADQSERLNLMTETFPPLTISQGDAVSGFSIDLLNSLFERTQSAQKAEDAQVYPWSKAYQSLQKVPNSCLFATARTPQRENEFQWVGPIAPLRIVLFARQSSHINIDSDADLKNYKIGTVRDGAPESLLVARGVPVDALEQVSSAVVNLKKLDRGRVDLFAYIESVGKYYANQLGYAPENFEAVYVLKELELFYAFNKQVPAETIQRLQQAYDQVKTDGTYEALYKKYF